MFSFQKHFVKSLFPRPISFVNHSQTPPKSSYKPPGFYTTFLQLSHNSPLSLHPLYQLSLPRLLPQVPCTSLLWFQAIPSPDCASKKKKKNVQKQGCQRVARLTSWKWKKILSLLSVLKMHKLGAINEIVS